MAVRWQWMHWLVCGALFMGCSKGGDAPVTPAASAISSATSSSTTETTAHSTPTATAAVEPPEQVVGRFLEALRNGDRDTVASLLTTAAREETVRLGYEINPPGDPSSKYEVGRVEFVNGDNPEALVSSTWTHDLGDGELFTFEAVWITRREDAGWRVSGLAVHDPQNEQPLVFNFENLAEVFEMKEQVEQAAEMPAEPARQAANPEQPAVPNVQ